MFKKRVLEKECLLFMWEYGVLSETGKNERDIMQSAVPLLVSVLICMGLRTTTTHISAIESGK